MINKGALAKYSQVEIMLGALPRDLGPKAVIKLGLDPRNPSTFNYERLRNHVLGKCATADAVVLLDLTGACMSPTVSPYSIPTGVPTHRCQ